MWLATRGNKHVLVSVGVPAGLEFLRTKPGVETPAYWHLFLRDVAGFYNSRVGGGHEVIGDSNLIKYRLPNFDKHQ